MMSDVIPSSSLPLCMVGVNHRTAALELRERLAFDATQTQTFLADLHARYPALEAVLLSTCNRVELYVAGGEVMPGPDELLGILAEFHHLPLAPLLPAMHSQTGLDAVAHLFAVTCSLDSMVLGETQIIGQVKQAYLSAHKAGCVGALGHALFQKALTTAKLVQEQTELTAGRLSIASVAVELVQSVFDRFDDKRVLCIGAGKMAALLLRHLQALKPQTMTIVNRSPARAQALAAAMQAQAANWDELPTLLTQADIILTSTGAPQPIITEALMRPILKARQYRPAVLVDIAVPRDVAPAVGNLDNLYLYNIDDLQQVADSNRKQRDQAIAHAQTIIAQQVQSFAQWRQQRDLAPLITTFHQNIQCIATEQMAMLLAAHPEWSPAQQHDVQRTVQRIISKILHTPTRQIRAADDPLRQQIMAEMLRELFALPAQPSSDAPAAPLNPAFLSDSPSDAPSH